MLSEKPNIVVGIDPSLKFVSQFAMINKYADVDNMAVLPIGIEDMPLDVPVFDTVFSMGILYHRISPIEHLQQLYSFLKPGGELVLETLILGSSGEDILFPKDRYAKMRNVWFVPSVKMMNLWLERVGFKNIRCVDITSTTTDEQRNTDWMHLETLKDYLNEKDITRTVEGYPAPLRAVFVANK